MDRTDCLKHCPPARWLCGVSYLPRWFLSAVDTGQGADKSRLTPTLLFSTSTNPRRPGAPNCRSLSPSSISPNTLLVLCSSSVMSAKYVKSMPRAGLMSVAVKPDMALVGRDDTVALETCWISSLQVELW